MGRLDCVVDRAVLEVVVAEVVVEVERQVNDESGLLALLDDDMERLYSELGEVGVGGQFDNGAELHVFAEAFSDGCLVLAYCGRVRVRGSRGFGEERERDALGDVSFDFCEFVQVRVGFHAHEGNGGKPVALLVRTVDERPAGGCVRRERRKGRRRRWKWDGRQHVLMHVAP
jgi:hypothetical protein